MEQGQSIPVRMVLNAWETYMSRTHKLINSLSDEQFLHAVAPGRNSGIYLLGHLIAVHDGMSKLLGFDDPLYPELDEVFVQQPDNAGAEFPSMQVLRSQWNTVSEKLRAEMESLSQEEWFGKHTAVEDEIFEREPHRNKLNIVVNRSGHLSYHLGQLALLGNRED